MEYPLHFKYRDVVSGNGFFAGVEILGRVLMSVDEDDDGVWFYGATPGAIAAFGETPDLAHAEFREIYRSILRDLAQESTDIADFSVRVKAFGLSASAETLAGWDTALARVRQNGTEIEGLPKKEAPEPTVNVHRLVMERPALPRFAPCDSEELAQALAPAA